MAKQAYNCLKQQEGSFVLRLCERLDEFEQGIISEMETCLLELSVELAEKIVNKHIQRNDIFIVDMITAALTKIKDQGRITVRISPDDYDRYLAHTDQSDEDIVAGHRLTVTRDELMKTGDCIFEREDSVLDVGVGSQINKIREVFLRDKRSDSQYAVL